MISRTWDGGQRALRIWLENDATTTPRIDPYWSYGREPGSGYRDDQSRWRSYRAEDLRRHSYLICDPADDTILHALEPFAIDAGPAIGTIHSVRHNHATSPARALTALWLASGRRETSPDDLARAHEITLAIALAEAHFPDDVDGAFQKDFCELAFRQLAADQHRLPPSWLTAIAERIRAASARSTQISLPMHKELDELLNLPSTGLKG